MYAHYIKKPRLDAAAWHRTRRVGNDHGATVAIPTSNWWSPLSRLGQCVSRFHLTQLNQFAPQARQILAPLKILEKLIFQVSPIVAAHQIGEHRPALLRQIFHMRPPTPPLPPSMLDRILPVVGSPRFGTLENRQDFRQLNRIATKGVLNVIPSLHLAHFVLPYWQAVATDRLDHYMHLSDAYVNFATDGCESSVNPR